MSTSAPSATSFDPSAFAELEAGFQGELIGTEHPIYDEHRRVWNGSIDRHPALVARCASVSDVIAALALRAARGSRWRSGVGATASPGSRVATGAPSSISAR